MARKHAGKVALHGIDGTVAFGALTAAKNKMQSHQLQDQFTKSQLQQGDGDIIGKAGTARERRVTLEVIVIDESTPSTLAAAKTNTILPADMFTLITVASSGITALDGDWNYEGGTYNGRIGEYHSLSLEAAQVQNGSSFVALALV